jgi:hypothetical protein
MYPDLNPQSGFANRLSRRIHGRFVRRGWEGVANPPCVFDSGVCYANSTPREALIYSIENKSVVL